MIIERNGCFLLQTLNTSYLFNILPSGHPEHLHYGASVISDKQYEAFLNTSAFGDGSESEEASLYLKNICYSLSEKHPAAGGNMIAYSDEYPEVALEDLPLEISSFGKGDIRDPFILITHENGSKTSDFVFEKASVNGEIKAPETLPGSYADKVDLPVGRSG